MFPTNQLGMLAQGQQKKGFEDLPPSPTLVLLSWGQCEAFAAQTEIEELVMNKMDEGSGQLTAAASAATCPTGGSMLPTTI